MFIYSLPCGVELDSLKRFHSLFQTHTQKPSLVVCLFLQHFIVTSFLTANTVYFFFHRIGSDRPQGFHQALYGSLCALQEEEWELFQYRVDNSK